MKGEGLYIQDHLGDPTAEQAVQAQAVAGDRLDLMIEDVAVDRL